MLDQSVPNPDKPPPTRCPVCGEALVLIQQDTIEGTLSECEELCRNCGYVTGWSYGSRYEEKREVAETKLIGMHDHLNRENYFRLEISLTQVVEVVRRMNFGEHRFMSELVRQRKTDPQYKNYSEFKKHTDMLEEILEAGFE